jgi:hypothetical protein
MRYFATAIRTILLNVKSTPMSIYHLFNTRYLNSLRYPRSWGKSRTKFPPLVLMDFCEMISIKRLRKTMK